jgi:hypothetical protein
MSWVLDIYAFKPFVVSILSANREIEIGQME